MARYGMIWKIKPELKEQYKKDHDEIWPDMADALKKAGYCNYSIFFREDCTCFAYLENDNLEKGAAWIASTDVWARWQKAMDKYFVKSDENIMGPEIKNLEEVFHID